MCATKEKSKVPWENMMMVYCNLLVRESFPLEVTLKLCYKR